MAVAGVAAGTAWFVLGRDDRDRTDGATAVASWGAVVVQRSDGTITIHDTDGEQIGTATSDLAGVHDVGLEGAVVLGLDGTPSGDGLAVLSLDDGSITPLDVSFDRVRRLGESSMLVADDGAGTGLELIDPAGGTTLDLRALAGRDDALTDAVTVRADDAQRFVAFDELRRSETVVVDVAAGTAVSLPGSLADLAFDRVLTSTNRGATVLLDLSDTAGERIGTVETERPAAMMLVDERTAVSVSAAGVVSRIDFADESVDEVTELATVLPVPPGTDPATSELVGSGLPLSSHTRLALFGERFVAFVDATGALVRSVDVPATVAPLLGAGVRQRCLTVGAEGGPFTLLDSEGGVIVTSFVGGTLVADSADGCVVAFDGSGATADVVAGIDLDRRLGATVVALSADADAAVEVSGRRATIVDLASGDGTDLRSEDDTGTTRITSVAFAAR